MRLFAQDPLLCGTLESAALEGLETGAARAVEKAWLSYLGRESTALAEVKPLASQALSEQILHLLLGPRAIRPRCWELSPENGESLLETISRFVRLGSPIDCITMSGAVKHYGFSAHHGVDFADILWLRRFVQLNRAVQQVYRPGIGVRIILEDVGERILDTYVDQLEQRISRYICELSSLARVVAPDVVSIVPESTLFPGMRVSAEVARDFDLIRGSPITIQIFTEIAAKAAALFATYLEHSERAGLVPLSWDHVPAGHNNLPAFLELQNLGFRGGIPLCQREYYIRCAQNGCGRELGPAEGRNEVATYLGVVLTRTRLGIVQSTVTDKEGAVPPVKLSFMQTAPGSPPSLERRRLEYVACTRGRKSGRHVSAWSGYGGFGRHDAGVSPGIWSPAEVRRMETKYIELRIPTDQTSHPLTAPVLIV